MKKAAPNAQARCLFCGVAGVTKEHILARQLTRLFDYDLPTGFHAVIHHEHSHPEVGRPKRVKTARTFAYVSRKFCRGCNGGWMNTADRAALPTLTAFVRNEATTLHPAQQQALALWTTKTVLAFLSIEPEPYRFAMVEHYSALYRRKAPLVGSQVFLGATGGDGDGGVEAAGQRAHSVFVRLPTGEARGFGSLLRFGSGLLYVVVHGRDDHQLRMRDWADRALRQVWPTQEEVRWPPRSRIRAQDIPGLPEYIQASSDFAPSVNPYI